MTSWITPPAWSLTSVGHVPVSAPFPSFQQSPIKLESKSVDQSDESPYLYQATGVVFFTANQGIPCPSSRQSAAAQVHQSTPPPITSCLLTLSLSRPLANSLIHGVPVLLLSSCQGARASRHPRDLIADENWPSELTVDFRCCRADPAILLCLVAGDRLHAVRVLVCSESCRG